MSEQQSAPAAANDEGAPPAMTANGHPITVLQNFQLEDFERAVYVARNYEAAGKLMLEGLRKLKLGGEFIGYATGDNPRLKVLLYTRFCAAIVTLLLDPAFGLSEDGFDHFASEHAIIDLLFRASVFETSDHMLPAIAEKCEPGTDPRNMRLGAGASLLKFLLTYSLRSGFSLNFEETFKRDPQRTFSLWAGMLSPLLTISPQAQANRETLLGLWPLFEDVKLAPALTATLSDTYMYASYGLRRDKHDLKGMVHRIFARAVGQLGVKTPGEHVMRERREARPRLGDRKPTILVCAEWFSSLHAMYRCYAPMIRELRESFRLVGMAQASASDEIGRAEFDEWIDVAVEPNIGELVRTIVSEVRPDIIYYPSLGMAMWWTVAASLRLAPIQLMTLGHPASSRSPVMDYVICESGSIGDPSLFSERIVTVPAASARYVMRPDAKFPEPIVDDHPEVVRVAVPAMLCKLTAPFMKAAQDIAKRAAELGRRTEFHFFINMLGLNLFQAAREIRDWLPNALIYERMEYNAYLAHMSRCHLHLSTFPFGGTNSNIDSMLLGIPVLSMEGDEPHQRFDAVQLRRAGLGERFIVRSAEEYVERAADLIVDDEQRNAARDLLRATDLLGMFFGEPEERHRGSFVNAMRTIYERHEEMQGADHRILGTTPQFPSNFLHV